jgi:hypothetical protein
MSKSQKGRRHRTVDRTPRPVGTAVRRPAGSTPVAPDAVESTPEVPDAVAPVPVAPAASAEEAVGALFQTAVRDGGLGLPAARTWRHLLESDPAGATVEEISAVVGYQPQTIGRHVNGLLKYGMVRESGGRWYPTGRSQWNAAAQHGPAAPALTGAR